MRLKVGQTALFQAHPDNGGRVHACRITGFDRRNGLAIFDYYTAEGKLIQGAMLGTEDFLTASQAHEITALQDLREREEDGAD